MIKVLDTGAARPALTRRLRCPDCVEIACHALNLDTPPRPPCVRSTMSLRKSPRPSRAYAGMLLVHHHTCTCINEPAT
jgi:hypothetical protein